MSSSAPTPDKHQAQALFRDGRLPEAQTAFVAWCARHPEDAEAWSTLGIIYGTQRDWERAEASCRRAIDADQTYSNAHANLGVVLEAKGRLDDALASYREALRLNPCAEIHQNIGITLKAQGRHTEAIRHFQEATALSPGNAEAWGSLGAALDAVGRFEEAETSFLKALRLAPRSFDAQFHMGNFVLARARQRYREAQTQYQKTFQQNPEYAETPGDSSPGGKAALGLFEQAAECYQQALQLNSQHAGAHNNLGIAHAALGKYEQAAASYQRALQLNPQHTGARININQLAARHGRIADLCEGSYQDWIVCYEVPDLQPARYAERVARLARRPLISIIMPVYNPNPRWLEDAIHSVQAQYYPEWELCIADDASTDAAIRPLLERLAAEDTRIRVAIREKNGHICAASNEALQLARGEFIGLLDHDDLLPPHALYWVAREIAEHADANLIYSDEDKIDAHGARRAHYFKPDWNPDLFASHNFVSHFGVYRTTLVRKLDGFREGFEGSQDYDLAWRVVDESTPSQIRHIPRVLYHWRTHRESTAANIIAKPYAATAAVAAIRDHLVRTGQAATVAETQCGYRVRYAVPSPAPLVSILIPTRNQHDLLRQCVTSILKMSTYPNYEILIIDNASDDPKTLEYLAGLEQDGAARVLRDARPFNFATLNNSAAASARGELLALINNDTAVITPDWLDEMVSHAVRPEIGAVGARLLYPDDTLQHAGVILVKLACHAHKGFNRKSSGYFGRARLIQNFSAVTAACLVVEKRKFTEVGGMDEALAVNFNDVDLCLRLAQKGYRTLWTPYAELYHHESVSRGRDSTGEKRERALREVAFMRDRWGKLLEADPAYNPNLTSVREDFTLAWPPRLG